MRTNRSFGTDLVQQQQHQHLRASNSNVNKQLQQMGSGKPLMLHEEEEDKEEALDTLLQTIEREQASSTNVVSHKPKKLVEAHVVLSTKKDQV